MSSQGQTWTDQKVANALYSVSFLCIAEASAARENADHACKQCLPLVNSKHRPLYRMLQNVAKVLNTSQIALEQEGLA